MNTGHSVALMISRAASIRLISYTSIGREFSVATVFGDSTGMRGPGRKSSEAQLAYIRNLS